MMTILSENLKTIRKQNNYTQKIFSEKLDIGFRTYVRYESGERDAPVSVIVKLAKQARVSLDRLLTTNIIPEDLDTPDQEKHQHTIIKNPQVIGGGIDEGRLMLKGFLNDNLVTNTKDEQKLLIFFRSTNQSNREKLLIDLEWIVNNSSKKKLTSTRKNPRKLEKEQTSIKLKKIATEIKEFVCN
jgi:transcriptional regulator with XRE-family HTH domain